MDLALDISQETVFCATTGKTSSTGPIQPAFLLLNPGPLTVYVYSFAIWKNGVAANQDFRIITVNPFLSFAAFKMNRFAGASVNPTAICTWDTGAIATSGNQFFSCDPRNSVDAIPSGIPLVLGANQGIIAYVNIPDTGATTWGGTTIWQER